MENEKDREYREKCLVLQEWWRYEMSVRRSAEVIWYDYIQQAHQVTSEGDPLQ